MANKIVYEDYAVGAIDYAKVDLSLTDQQMQTVVDGSGAHEVDPYDVESIFGDTASEYATFDSYGINLLRTVHVFSAGESAGFVSDRISGSDCSFTNPPKLVIFFEDEQHNSKIFSGNGITLHFSDKICTKVRVKYLLSDDTYMDATEYNGLNSKNVYLPQVVHGYKQIQIEFLETETPYQYAKVCRIEFGHTVTIDKFRTISFNKKIDFYCSDVAINTLDVSIMSDSELNFYENQKLLLYRNEELIGTYWVADAIKQTDKQYDITAEDVFSRAELTERESIIIPTWMSDVTFAPLLDLIERDTGFVFEANEVINERKQSLIQGFCSRESYRRFLAELSFALQLFPVARPNNQICFKNPFTNGITEHRISGAQKIGYAAIIGDAVFKSEPAETELALELAYQKPYTNNPNEKLYEGTISESGVSLHSEYPIDKISVYYGDSLVTSHYTRTWICRDEINDENISLCDFQIRLKSSYSSEASRSVTVYVSTYRGNSFNISASVISTTEKIFKKNFGKKPFYGNDMQNRMDGLVRRMAAKKGTVTAKIILNYKDIVEGEEQEKILDVGDYVEIETKYSGIKRGTITDISNADVGVNDIVGNVVITVWE